MSSIRNTKLILDDQEQQQYDDPNLPSSTQLRSNEPPTNLFKQAGPINFDAPQMQSNFPQQLGKYTEQPSAFSNASSYKQEKNNYQPSLENYEQTNSKNIDRTRKDPRLFESSNFKEPQPEFRVNDSQSFQSNNESSFIDNIPKAQSLRGIPKTGFNIGGNLQTQGYNKSIFQNKNSSTKQTQYFNIHNTPQISQQYNLSQSQPKTSQTSMYSNFFVKKQKNMDEQPQLGKQQSLDNKPQKKKSTRQKIKIKKEIRYQNHQQQPIKLQENNHWIVHLNNYRLEWKNSKNSPLEVIIMLNQFLKQASSETIKEFQNKIPISQALPLSSRFNQYSGNPKMLAQIKQKAKQFPVYRQIRGDGNCFYRAFNFGFLEMALTHRSSLYFLKFLSIIGDPSKVSFETDRGNYKVVNNHQLRPSKMRSFVIHRLLLLYSYRVSLAQNNDQNWQCKIISMLQQVFNESPFCFDAFLIIGIKNFIVHSFKSTDIFSFQQQSGKICNQILQYGKECSSNQYNLQILASSLCIRICMSQQINSQCRLQAYGQKQFGKVDLYFRPGHYDLIYSYKKVYEEVFKNAKVY